MPLAVTEALSPNKPNLDMPLAVAETLSPNNNDPNFHAEVLIIYKYSILNVNININITLKSF